MLDFRVRAGVRAGTVKELLAVLAFCAAIPAISQAPVHPQDGQCAAVAGDSAHLHACTIRVLRSADEALNTEYAEVIGLSGKAQAEALVEAQRAWLRSRDRQCSVRTRARSRAAWLLHVADSQNRAACVIAVSRSRTEELRQLKNRMQAPPMQAAMSPPLDPLQVHVKVSPAPAPAAQRAASSETPRTGRFYYEATIDETRASGNEALVSMRVATGDRVLLAEHPARVRDLVLKPEPSGSIRIVGGDLGDLRIPKLVIGWAVDLDAGRAYVHRNGEWINEAAPGSPRGFEIEPASHARAEVVASQPLEALVASGLLQVNFGREPFSDFAPAGFRGFDWPQHLVVSENTARAGSGRNVPPVQVQWMQRFAEWARSFPPEVSPSADTTGERCGIGQSGDVWFLAGVRGGGSAQRDCAVPHGKAILVPVMNSVIQAPEGISCEELQVALRRVSGSATDLRFSLDGKRWSVAEIRESGTSCFRMRDANGVPNTAATAGHWVMLPPLRPGRHEIRFGGRLAADGFAQDVVYRLEVR